MALTNYRKVNDGKMSWRATVNDYTDGNKNSLNALGALVEFDFYHVQSGWINFEPGAGPDDREFFLNWPMTEEQEDEIENRKPASTRLENAFRIPVRGARIGGRRILTAAGETIRRAVDGLHDAFVAAPESKLGLLPIVTLSSKPTMLKNGDTLFVPVLTIAQWSAPAGSSPPAAASSIPSPSTPVPLSVAKARAAAASGVPSRPTSPAPTTAPEADEDEAEALPLLDWIAAAEHAA